MTATATGARQRLPWIFLAMVAAALIPYVPFLPLPGISDDYMQIGLGREFLTGDGPRHLLSHALYRTRATSIVFTRMLDLAFGHEIPVHRFAGVLLHAVNGMLVFAMGFWPRIGYRRSFVAAIAFVLASGHQEAIVWVAAVHELLVFTFSIACINAWLRWLYTRHAMWLAFATIAFVLALFSKESAAVLPALLAGLWLLEGERRRADLLVVALGGAMVLVYTWLVFAASRDHQHLNDGTFSLHAPFVLNLVRTLWRVFWPWGIAAAGILVWLRRPWPLAAALACSAVALLPYSFLTYMPHAPSRHTYLATLGLAVTVAFAWDALSSAAGTASRRAAVLFAVLFALFNPVYLWVKKYPHYVWRGRPTEAFLAFAQERGKPVFVGPTPYGVWVYRYTAFVVLGWNHGDVVSIAESRPSKDTPVFTHRLQP